MPKEGREEMERQQESQRRSFTVRPHNLLYTFVAFWLAYLAMGLLTTAYIMLFHGALGPIELMVALVVPIVVAVYAWKRGAP